MIKLRSLKFHPGNKFRKLEDLTLEFADRITLIAGHNGVGKSTILGLIASASGQNKQITYFNEPFSFDINKIVHLDPDELNASQLTNPWPLLTYEVIM